MSYATRRHAHSSKRGRRHFGVYPSGVDKRSSCNTRVEDGIVGYSPTNNHAAAEQFKTALGGHAASPPDPPSPQEELSCNTTSTQQVAVEKDFDSLLDSAIKQRIFDLAFRGDPSDHSKYRRQLFDGGWRDQTDVWEASTSHRPFDQPAPLIMDVLTLKSVMVLDTDPNQPRASNLSCNAQSDANQHQPAHQNSSLVSATKASAKSNMLDPERHQEQSWPSQHDVFSPPNVVDFIPLSADHPVRAWNLLMHSLPSALQPIIKWNYERSRDTRSRGSFRTG